MDPEKIEALRQKGVVLIAIGKDGGQVIEFSANDIHGDYARICPGLELRIKNNPDYVFIEIKHEKWTYGEDNDGWYLQREGSSEQLAHGLTEEDARRIAACVNACAGLGTAHLENIVMLGDTLLSRIELLKKTYKG